MITNTQDRTGGASMDTWIIVDRIRSSEDTAGGGAADPGAALGPDRLAERATSSCWCHGCGWGEGCGGAGDGGFVI